MQADETAGLVAGSIIGAVLELGQTGAVPPRVRSLTDEDFPTIHLGEIWQAIEACLADGGKCDPAMTVAKLKQIEAYEPGDLALLMRLWGECPGTANVEHWAKQLREWSIRNRTRAQIEEAKRQADTESDPLIAAQRLRDAVRVIEPESEERDRSLAMAWDELHSGQAQRHFAFGIGNLDNAIRLSRAQLLVIGAEPGTGKTALATQLGWKSAEDGHRVVFVSLEMSPQAIRHRMLANITGIPLSKIFTPRQWTDADQGLVSMAMNKMHAAINFSLTMPRDIRIGAILAQARTQKPDVLVVDYLGLIKPDERGDRKDLEVGEVVRALKRFALEQNCLVVCLSQFNRAEGKPTMSRLRDSGEIEQVADTIALMWLPDQSERSEVELHVAKQRSYTPGADVRLVFRGGVQRFSEA